jgi:uncharacterized protein YbaR (Trm112 family)
MLRKELLDILCCPVCKGDLEYDETQARLTCRGCARTYPVKGGIPMMMVDESSE